MEIETQNLKKMITLDNNINNKFNKIDNMKMTSFHNSKKKKKKNVK